MTALDTAAHALVHTRLRAATRESPPTASAPHSPGRSASLTLRQADG